MKYLIVTGSNGGLGTSVIQRLLNEEYFIFSLDISEKSKIEHQNLKYIKCDVSKYDDIVNAFSIISKEANEIFGIVNLAGIFIMQSVVEGSYDDLKKIVDINFFGTYLINKTFFPLLKNDSRIINMSSEVARYSPQPFMLYYSMTKKMVDSYSDVLRRECNYIGIRVIKIQSGSMNTNMLKSANENYDKIITNTKYFEKPLEKLKYMMDRELKKTNSPLYVANLIAKILSVKKPKIRYKIKNSFALQACNALPENLQDFIYKKVIK